MSYETLVNNQLDKVFNKLVKDFSKEVKVITTSGTSFDFSTAGTETETETPKTIKAIPLKTVRSRSGQTFIKMLFHKKTAGDLNSWSEIIHNDKTYSRSEIINDTGFVILAEFSEVPV